MQYLPRAVLVGLVALLVHVLAEHLLALLAREDDLRRPENLVVLTLHVALGAVKPLLAALRAHRNLRIQNVFAHPV